MSWKNVQYENGKYRTSEGGGGGASALTDLDDVNISSPSQGEVLKYDANTQKWVNGADTAYPFTIVNGKVCIVYETNE